MKNFGITYEERAQIAENRLQKIIPAFLRLQITATACTDWMRDHTGPADTLEILTAWHHANESAMELLRHRHEAGNFDLDKCAECGLDLRNPIHFRA